ncbi:MAG: DUF4149 domain-containing protein [Phycisphaerae bacterium]|nr:DUF4149 domain-containing protein [Phycisphaerae bacterium]
MRSAAILLACAAVTLWLGGLLALFVFVQALFSTDRVLAAQAAPLLFRVFQMYQIILFAVSLVAMAIWRRVAPGRAVSWTLTLIIAAGACAILHAAIISPPMHELTAAGQSAGPEFRRLHRYSMLLFTTEGMILTAAACLLPQAIIGSSPPPRQRTSSGTAAG